MSCCLSLSFSLLAGDLCPQGYGVRGVGVRGKHLVLAVYRQMVSNFDVVVAVGTRAAEE